MKPSDKNETIDNRIQVILIEDNPRDTQLIYEILGKDAENYLDLKRVVLLPLKLEKEKRRLTWSKRKWMASCSLGRFTMPSNACGWGKRPSKLKKNISS
jgi:hypothetical protein